MHYDPIKTLLGKIFNRNKYLRILFYKLLDLLLLRAWYIKKELKAWNLKTKMEDIEDKKRQATEKNEVEILDAGSGFGQYSYYMTTLDSNYKITGVDIWEEHIQDCNNFFRKLRKDNIIFRIADLTRHIEPDKYHLIITIDVMEHILEDEKVFHNFYLSLKRGGMLLISTPSDQGGSDAASKEDKSFIEEHVRNGYNIEEIKDKLKKAGFENIEANYSYGKPGQVSWLLSMKLPILMLSYSKILMILLPFYYIAVYPFCFVMNMIDVSTRHKSGTGLIVKAYK